jgi:hypothetical protein
VASGCFDVFAPERPFRAFPKGRVEAGFKETAPAPAVECPALARDFQKVNEVIQPRVRLTLDVEPEGLAFDGRNAHGLEGDVIILRGLFG